MSYLEWYQNMHNEKWSEDKVNRKLKKMMEKAFETVWLKSVKNSQRQLKSANTDSNRFQPSQTWFQPISTDSAILDLKQAAFEVAIERIVSSLKY